MNPTELFHVWGIVAQAVGKNFLPPPWNFTKNTAKRSRDRAYRRTLSMAWNLQTKLHSAHSERGERLR